MRKTITFAAIAAASFISLSANSAVFGSYVQSSKSEFDQNRGKYNNAQFASFLMDAYTYKSDIAFNYFPSEYAGVLHKLTGVPINYHSNAICVDNTSRKVPGKLLGDGYCYVEWGGKNWKNSEYRILQNDFDYSWRPLTKNYKLKGDEVTAGGWDTNEYSYHCIAESVYYGYENPRFRVLGKYIPRLNTCFVGIGTDKGRTFAVGIGDLVRNGNPKSLAGYNYAWVLVAPGKSGGGNGGGTTPIDPPFDDCFNTGKICP